MKSSKHFPVVRLALVLVTTLALVTGCEAGNATQASGNGTDIQTAKVTTITAVSSVSASGTAVTLQSVSVSWKTSGTVGQVNVKSGDQIKADDVLMSIDQASIPDTVNQAQADLLSAQEALDTLLHPTDLSIANAKKAIADAQTAVNTAQKDLASLKNVDVAYYREQLKKAQDALTTAKENVVATDIGSLYSSRANAQNQLTLATNIYNDAKDAFERCPLCVQVFVNAANRKMEWKDVVQQYNDAVNNMDSIKIRIAQAERQNSTSVADAQANVEDAQRNLNWALLGPKTLDVAQKEAAVAVAVATATEAQDKLNKLLDPDPADIAAAEAKVHNAQAVLDALTIKAPIAGEVMVVNYQPGDIVSQSNAAVIIADRSHVRIEAVVDESQVGKIKAGNPVTITVDAVPDLALAGSVNWINPLGTSSQGLVKYTVRVDAAQADARILPGMTANIFIVTDTKTGALAIPLQALQYDSEGEFVNRVQADGYLERVPVTSGQIQSKLIIVTGNLKNGDQVELAQATTTTTTSGGGPGGGFGGLFGGGGR